MAVDKRRAEAWSGWVWSGRRLNPGRVGLTPGRVTVYTELIRLRGGQLGLGSGLRWVRLPG
jgi:hypothetical protein